MEDNVSIPKISLGGKVGPADVGVFKVRKEEMGKRQHCMRVQKEKHKKRGMGKKDATKTPFESSHTITHLVKKTNRFPIMGLDGVLLVLDTKLRLKNAK